MTDAPGARFKPMGPIPPEFTSEDGMLLVGGRGVAALVDEVGETPLFVYDAAIVRARIAGLRAAMPPQLGIHYAIKANPFAPLLAMMAPLVDGFDIASEGELDRALASGMAAPSISFAGPGKTDRELRAAIMAGVTLNLEAEEEGDRALAIAHHLGIRPRLAVRVNPDFELKGSGMRMGGGAKPFGIDADRAGALARHVISAGADWRGWHVFAGSQALDAQSIIAAQAATLDLVARLSDEAGAEPPQVNLGGGFGIPYFAGDKPLDIAAIGSSLAENLRNRPGSHYVIELGRYLVAEAGVYLNRAVVVKRSKDELFVITDGGLHHQLAASGNFGTVVRRNYPVAVANRFGAALSDKPQTVVGCLCTPLDRLAEAVALPPMQTGDLIAVFLAGAYGATASPSAFLGHAPATELLVDGD